MYSAIQVHDEQGIRMILLDVPGNPVNAIGPSTLAELESALDEPTLGETALRGLVIASAKPNAFCAGADLFHIRDLDDAQRLAFLERGQQLAQRLAALPFPTVAAINGVCLGGGLEIALACDYRVAGDDGSIKLGLPEVMIGILPGWGGATRMVHRIGVRQSLPLLLTGKSISPRKARKLGLVDEVVRPEALLAAATRLIRTAPPPQRPPLTDRWIHRHRWLYEPLLHLARRRVLAKTFGQYPAPEKLLDTLRTTFDDGPEAGFEAVGHHLVQLLQTDASRNQMRLFFLRQQAKHAAQQQAQAEPMHVHYAAVIGGGTMGAGITHALLRSGVQVRLVDLDEASISAALRHIHDLVQADRRAYRISPLQAEQLMRNVAPATDFTGLRRAEFVIEAVPEHMELKQRVFHQLDQIARPDTVLATNTSSLDITALARGTRRPQRIVGLHFFNPVPHMPLVEVVRTAHSDPQALATAIELALQLGKTPVLVNDAPGFLINRMLFPYLAEALTMAVEGADIRDVDHRMKRWGMPMGPYELLDTVGLDVVIDIFHAVRGRLGDYLVMPASMQIVIDHRWLGRKSGIGFYHYVRGWRKRLHRPPVVNHQLLRLIRQDSDRPAPPGDETENRLVMPMINEMARVLDEGVVPGDQPLDLIDLATVLGLGWAPFRGGLGSYARSLGAATIVERLSTLADRHGERFAPAPSLRRLAELDQPMDALARSAAPPAYAPVPVPPRTKAHH